MVEVPLEKLKFRKKSLKKFTAAKKKLKIILILTGKVGNALLTLTNLIIYMLSNQRSLFKKKKVLKDKLLNTSTFKDFPSKAL